MRKKHKITQNQAQEARAYLKRNKIDTKAYRRLEVIALRGEGYDNAEIQLITQFSYTYISDIVRLFINEGFEGLLTDNRKGGNRQKVSFEETEEFLKSYQQVAESGKVILANDLRLDFMEKFKVEITLGSFYKLLRRHKWRKVIPRTVHPKKADAQTIEASKKLTSCTENC